jgi:hypothetical protein
MTTRRLRPPHCSSSARSGRSLCPHGRRQHQRKRSGPEGVSYIRVRRLIRGWFVISRRAGVMAACVGGPQGGSYRRTAAVSLPLGLLVMAKGSLSPNRCDHTFQYLFQLPGLPSSDLQLGQQRMRRLLSLQGCRGGLDLIRFGSKPPLVRRDARFAADTPVAGGPSTSSAGSPI